MPLPPYSWNPDVQVEVPSPGVVRVSWNHIVIDNPVAPVFDTTVIWNIPGTYPATHAGILFSDDPVTGTTPEEVPMPPEDIHQAEWSGATALTNERWAGLGLFAYEVFFDGVLVGRTHMSSIQGLLEQSSEVGLAPGSDSLGNLQTTTHSYSMEPYTAPDNTIDITAVIDEDTEVTIDALYEEIPPNETWTFTPTHCLHYTYDVVWVGDHWECTGPLPPVHCQEENVPGVLHANFAWPADYPDGAVNDYLFYRPTCLAEQTTCPCNPGTCAVVTVCPEELLGVYTGNTVIGGDYGTRYRIPGVPTFLTPIYNLDREKGFVWA